MFMGKNKISTSARSSIAVENGHINPSINKTPNVINRDETKRTSQQNTDHFLAQPQYGKTLNVPDTNVLQVLPVVTPAAPITPPRPAIMTTPKSSTTIAAKNSANDTLPLLLVTTVNDQQKPQTVTISNGQRLQLNGRLATIAPTKQRQQPAMPMMTNNHQIINEIIPKKPINNLPRTAVFCTTTRMKSQTIYLFIKVIFLGNMHPSSEQHQSILNNGNDTTNRHDSIDSHTSTDDGIDNWSSAPRLIIFFIFFKISSIFLCSFSESYRH
jgi:hypothetical protein